MSRSHENARHALDTLARFGRVSDRRIGDMLGLSRQSAYAKRHGPTAISLEDIDDLAEGFDVPATVFLMDHQELMRWLSESNWRGPGTISGQGIHVGSWKHVGQGTLFDIDETLCAA